MRGDYGRRLWEETIVGDYERNLLDETMRGDYERRLWEENMGETMGEDYGRRL